MAVPRRGKKKSRRKTGANVPALGPGDLIAVPDAPDLAERLTSEILALDRVGKTRVVENVVAIGLRLLALQRHLGFGAWLPWLVDRLPYSPRTAQRYIQVAQWAGAFPEDVERFAPLGLGKLQLLATLPENRRARFRVPGRRFRIPGVSKRKTLEVMTHRELGLVIAGPDSLTAPPPAIPIGTVLQRFRHRVAGLDAMADVIRARATEVDADDIEELHADLLAVAEELEAAFDL